MLWSIDAFGNSASGKEPGGLNRDSGVSRRMGNACKGSRIAESDHRSSGSGGGFSQIFPLNDKMHFKTPRIPYCAFSPTIDSLRRKIPSNSGRFGESAENSKPILWTLYIRESRRRIMTHEQLEKVMVNMGWKARTPRHGWRSYCHYRHGPFGPSWVVARLPYPSFVDSRTDYLDEFIADVNNACGKTCFALQKLTDSSSDCEQRMELRKARSLTSRAS